MCNPGPVLLGTRGLPRSAEGLGVRSALHGCFGSWWAIQRDAALGLASFVIPPCQKLWDDIKIKSLITLFTDKVLGTVEAGACVPEHNCCCGNGYGYNCTGNCVQQFCFNC